MSAKSYRTARAQAIWGDLDDGRHAGPLTLAGLLFWEMSSVRLCAAAVVTAALALPSSALAQNGAADQQYADPFGNTTKPTATSRGHHRTSPRRPASAQATKPAGAAVTSTPATITAPASTGPRASALPRTGADSGLQAVEGAGLLAAGLALRLLLRRSRGFAPDRS